HRRPRMAPPRAAARGAEAASRARRRRAATIPASAISPPAALAQRDTSALGAQASERRAPCEESVALVVRRLRGADERLRGGGPGPSFDPDALVLEEDRRQEELLELRPRALVHVPSVIAAVVVRGDRDDPVVPLAPAALALLRHPDGADRPARDH